MNIYVVYHITYENSNVFFTNKEVAIKYVNEVVTKLYPNSKLEEWFLREIEEGVEFNADMSCF